VRYYTIVRKHRACHVICAHQDKICTKIFPWIRCISVRILLPGSFIPMLTSTILNPHLLSLLARVRHTNALVIADRGFPFWTEIEIVDISLMNNVPTVIQVLSAIRGQFQAASGYMAKEFLEQNAAETRQQFADALQGIPMQYESHVELKKRVPKAMGLIRTGDTVQYANIILISG
jgi:D-ribose pyranase